MPVVVLVHGLPILQDVRLLICIGHRVQHQVKRFRNAHHPLQGAPNQPGQFAQRRCFAEIDRSKEDSCLRGMIQISYGTRDANGHSET